MVGAQSLSLNSFTFLKNLSLGDKNVDVLNLQKVLNTSSDTSVANSGFGSPGNETTYFGNLTKQAVIKFQEKYRSEVLAPINLFSGTGFVGSLTRAKLNTILTSNNNQSTNTQSIPPITPTNVFVPTEEFPKTATQILLKPSIHSISPTNGTNGTEITIKGNNFSEDNTILISFDPDSRYKNIPSTKNGTEIKFRIDSEILKAIERKDTELTSRQSRILREQFPDFDLPIIVSNNNGTSGSKFFTLEVE